MERHRARAESCVEARIVVLCKNCCQSLLSSGMLNLRCYGQMLACISSGSVPTAQPRLRSQFVRHEDERGQTVGVRREFSCCLLCRIFSVLGPWPLEPRGMHLCEGFLIVPLQI